MVTARHLWLATAVLATLVFTAFPNLDLWVTALFWSPDSGFFLGNWPPFHLAFAVVPILTWILVAGLLALLAAAIVTDLPLARRQILFLLLSFAIGPGLLTNAVLKDHWGRARPSAVTEFGGTKTFTPALEPTDQCTHNCSFVSGHGAMAFSLIGFAYLPATRRRRLAATTAALAFGAFVSLARIAQGGHFLSDTVFAALVATGTAWLLHRWIVDARGLEQPWALRLGRIMLGFAAGIQRFLGLSAEFRWRRWLAFDLVCAVAIGVSILFIDRPLARFFHLPDDRLTAVLHGISDLGLGEVSLAPSGAAALALLLLGRAPRFAGMRERFTAWALAPGFIFVAVALSGLAADLLKILVGRTRPKLLFQDGTYGWGGFAWQADHWSFPSGHTANAAALALALFFLWPRHVVAYALFVVLIAFSRIGLDQHYLSDTIGGAWIAVLVTCYLRGVLLRRGLSFADAKAGVTAPLPPVSWLRLLAPWRAHSL